MKIKSQILAVLCLATAGHAQVQISGSVSIGGQVNISTGTPRKPSCVITTTIEPSGVVNTSYTGATIATANCAAPILYSILSGAIPTGTTLNTSTGVVSGTPTAAGNFAFVLKGIDSSSPAQTATQSLTIQIATGGVPSGGHNEDCNSSNQWIGASSKPLIGGSASAPHACINTALANTPSPGSTISVPAGSSCATLQSDINNIVPGQKIVIAAQNGAAQDTFSNCRLTISAACNASNWCTIETDQLANLPAEGNRVSPAYVGISSMAGYPVYSQPATPGIYMPKIITGTTGNWVIQFQPGAAYWRLIGLELTSPAGSNAAQLVQGTGASFTGSNIILDRMILHGGNSPIGQDMDDIQAGWGEDGFTYAALIDSYLYDFHCSGHGCAQSQAVTLGGNSANPSGPFKVTNNFLSSAGEIVFSGGAGNPNLVTLPSTDAEIRLNHMFKPFFWKVGDPTYNGKWYELDNIIETKNSLRWWIEGNILEHSVGAQGTQQGNAVIFGARSQNNPCCAGGANSDGAGNITWASGGKFQNTLTSPTCGVDPGHCLFIYNSLAYEVATVVSPTQLTLQLCQRGCANAGGIKAGATLPPVGTALSFTAFNPGDNPNAIVDDMIFINNQLHGAARVGGIATAVSDGGDLAKEEKRIYVGNNASDWIDGCFWNNNALQAGSVWGTGWQIQGAGSTGLFPDSVAIVHNSMVEYLTCGNPGVGPGFIWGMNSTHQMTSLMISDNVSAGGVDPLSGNARNAFVGAIASAADGCFDHNMFAGLTNPFGPNGNAKRPYGTADNPPYPLSTNSGGCGYTTNGNLDETDYNALDFTSINTGTSTVNFQLTGSSPGHGAGSDGISDIGVNWTNLQNAIAGVY